MSLSSPADHRRCQSLRSPYVQLFTAPADRVSQQNVQNRFRSRAALPEVCAPLGVTNGEERWSLPDWVHARAPSERDDMN